MENTVRAMMGLIANEVCGSAIDKKEYSFSQEELVKLYKLSKTHDLAHLVGDALIKNDLLSDAEIRAKFEKQIMVAVLRYEKINYELECLRETLNEAKIPFIPLKGSVIRQYYPEPWMRTSCDIDILVHESDLEAATSAVVEKLSYEEEGKGSHDIGLFSPGGVHLELHYSLIESDIIGKADRMLEPVWEQVSPTEKYPYDYEMTDALYYYYHIAHMAKHFQNGGCGVRPFLDIWVLEHCVPHDEEKRRELLQEGGLLTFATEAENLSGIWFSGVGYTDTARQMESYILYGGVYGNVSNRVSVQQAKQGGKVRYALSRIWLPYHVMKRYYLSLDGKPLLLPFYEVYRWFGLLFNGGVKRGVNELKINGAMTEEQQNGASELLSHLGLD